MVNNMTVNPSNVLTSESLLAGIQETRLVAIVRGTDGGAAATAALAAMEEGFRYVEIALTTPDALEAISAVRAAAPAGCFVGAGTVLTAQDVDDVAEAGGQFMVTPSLAESIAGLRGPGHPRPGRGADPDRGLRGHEPRSHRREAFSRLHRRTGLPQGPARPVPRHPVYRRRRRGAGARRPATGRRAPSPSASADRSSVTPVQAATWHRCGSGPGTLWRWPPTMGCAAPRRVRSER